MPDAAQDQGIAGAQRDFFLFSDQDQFPAVDVDVVDGIRLMPHQRRQIVHDIDLRDERYLRPEAAGVDLVLEGWLAADLSDADLEAQGIGLFEALYQGFSRTIRKARTRGRPRAKR
jgi:hypothetical protein